MPIDPNVLWLAVDPGEDTGWSLWRGETWIDAGTEKLWPFCQSVFTAVFEDPEIIPLLDDELANQFQGIQRIVCEDFRLYPWEAQKGSLNWDQMRTARAIGALTIIARMGRLDFVLQPAKIKEQALAAGAEAYFLKPLHENRHANDSTMHGTWFITSQNNKNVKLTENVSAREGEE